MVSVEDRGSTCSGRTYLPDYFERVPAQRCKEIIENLLKSKRVDIDNLSDILEIMSIHRTTVNIPEKALKNIVLQIIIFLKNLYYFLILELENIYLMVILLKFCRQKLSVDGKMKIQEDISESSMM